MKKVYFFVVLLLAPILAIGCGPYGPMGGWEPGHMMNYGFGYGGMFMWLIFLIVLGVVIYFIVQTLKSKNVAGQAKDNEKSIFLCCVIVGAGLSHRLRAIWADVWMGTRAYDELWLWIRRYVYVGNIFNRFRCGDLFYRSDFKIKKCCRAGAGYALGYSQKTLCQRRNYQRRI